MLKFKQEFYDFTDEMKEFLETNITKVFCDIEKTNKLVTEASEAFEYEVEPLKNDEEIESAKAVASFIAGMFFLGMEAFEHWDEVGSYLTNAQVDVSELISAFVEEPDKEEE